MRCQICKKLLKENTEGNNKYCQGHSLFEEREALCDGCGEPILENESVIKGENRHASCS
jgi:predicted amidophosphoribosyltransferase